MNDVSVPIELQIDKYHPSNQDFMQRVRQCERLIVHHTALCRPNHVEALKRHIRGQSNEEIATEMRRSSTNISTVLHRKEILQLKQSLTHLATLYMGPSLEHRKRHLWEISVDTKQDDPRVSIQAVKEMNNMDGVGHQKVDPKVEITINTNTFPQNVLDEG
jgi:hypothetical protein